MIISRLLIAGTVLFSFCLPSYAAIVTVNGDNVRFTYDDSTIYGSANVVGDAIFFLPTNFRAESLNGAGLDTVSGPLSVRVEVLTAGFWLEELQLVEQGDYFLSGTGASVSATGDFTVSSNTLAFSATDSLSAGALTVQGATTDWAIQSTIDLSDTLGWFGDFDVDVDIENVLTADTLNGGEQAWIQKKVGGVGLMITAVPVPAAAWLFISGLGLLGGIRRMRG